MNYYPRVALALLSLMLAVGNAAAGTLSVNEQEPNDPLLDSNGNPTNLAQFLNPPDTMTPVVVSGYLGNGPNGANDLDFYSFFAQEGDTVTISVTNPAFAAWLGLFSPDSSSGSLYHLYLQAGVQQRSYAGYCPGTVRQDPCLQNVPIPETGIWTIGVSNAGRYFTDGGVAASAPTASGNYTLTLSGARPAIKEINIEIKPDQRKGSKEWTVLNPKEHGKIKVALLASKTFDPTTVVTTHTALRFGATGEEHSLNFCEPRLQDVNHDGVPDLICHFNMQEAGFLVGDTIGKVKGNTKDGMKFEGQGSLKVIPGDGHEQRTPRKDHFN